MKREIPKLSPEIRQEQIQKLERQLEVFRDIRSSVLERYRVQFGMPMSNEEVLSIFLSTMRNMIKLIEVGNGDKPTEESRSLNVAWHVLDAIAVKQIPLNMVEQDLQERIQILKDEKV